MNESESTARTFDALCDADLDQVYEQGKEEVLRDHAFRILLACTNTIEKLEKLAYARERWPSEWSIKELIEITNHFRLLSSPENEIRLYRECQDETFRNTPRVREFYLLALNKAKRPSQAIQEGSRIIAEGSHNALVWATLGESYSAKMHFAEQLVQALTNTGGKTTAIDNELITLFPSYFPEVDLKDMTVARAHALRNKNLRSATRIFRRGFRESGSSFLGLGWMLRTLDYQVDLMVEREQLLQQLGASCLRSSEEIRLRVIDEEMKVVEKELESQAILIGTALELQGGRESLDYWTDAGRLLLAVIQGVGIPVIRKLLANLFATVDAEFEFAITVSELQRIKNNFTAMIRVKYERDDDTISLDAQIECAEFAITECNVVRSRFREAGRDKVSALKEEYRKAITCDPDDALTAFLCKTVNFRALTSNLKPLYISGGLCRVGSRVPDLLINRRVQDDLADLVETKIIQALPLEDRENPRAVIARIQKVVGDGLKVGNLQDLQSPAHSAFDIRSDGLITLSGVDPDMRINTRSGTDLTAALLLQNGDCRETMYLNGVLFACWQQMQVKKRIADAMLCLQLDFQEGFNTIVNNEIPALRRYQLRGGLFLVYVDSIAMRNKYQCERVSDDDATAVHRPYGVAELRSGQPLTPYELENSKIEVTYTDGSTTWIEPKDPVTGKWLPINHNQVPGGGVPIIPNAGANHENIRSLQLWNLVEEHALTFLYDEQQKTMEFCDGFFNERLFDSPYIFGSGPVRMEEIYSNNGLICAGSRTVVHPDGFRQQHKVCLEFLPFSRTDYETTLVEGDIPGTIQLMGRTFSGDLKRERQRLEEGTSPIPALLEKIQEWQTGKQQSLIPHRKATERKLARLMLDLAWNLPEQMQLQKVSAEQPLIIEETENPNVYLVLSGQLRVYLRGQLLHDRDDNPVVSSAGSILGEISALSGGIASATVMGDAFVLGIPIALVQQHLSCNQEFRRCMEELASYYPKSSPASTSLSVSA
jgi:hypothetical protein